MKILIHGRQDGHCILYPPKPIPIEFYLFADDIQSGSVENNAIYYGKIFYTLAFASDGCIFSKYVIGDDVKRGQLGEIGISVFIPNTHKLSGAELKKLLDELVNTYCNNYISGIKIVEPGNGYNWLLFTSLANGYDTELLPRSSNHDIFKAGKQEPAFHYYKSENELIEHLDKPFQEEYSDYKQIYFIDSHLKGDANPLNVLKNSGHEVNPDLENQYYYLDSYDSSKEVRITANGNLRSDKKGETLIRAKWQIEINYSKEDRCYEPINVSGRIYDSSSEIHKYIERKGNHIMLKYDAFNNPPKKEESVAFKIRDQNGQSIDGAEIQIGTQPFVKVNESTLYRIFHGEDIIKQLNVSAKKESEDFFSKHVTITPYTDRSVELTLQKQKKVKLIAIDNDTQKPIEQFKFRINDSKGYRDYNEEIVFVNDDIDKNWTVEISKSEEGYTHFGETIYCPKSDGNHLRVICQKSLKYKIIAGEHGKKTSNCPQYSNSRTGIDLDKNYINANRGYIFKNWELINNTHVAQYRKKKYFYQNPKFIAGTVASALVLGVGIWTLFYWRDNQSKETLVTVQQITAYVEGDSLNHSALNDFKEKWKKREQDFIAISGGGMFGGVENIDSTKWKSDWQHTYKSIEQAITKRNLINNNNFAELKKLRYSDVQHSFKTAIEKIDSTKYAEVGSLLGDVSTHTLKQIAEKINEILNPKEPAKEEITQEPKKEEPNYEQNKETSVKVQEPKEQLKPQEQSAPNDITSEIILYINGIDITKATLNQYFEDAGNNTNLIASINLCLKLWSLDGTSSNSYSSYQGELKQDTNLNNSELKQFVDAMCGKKKPRYIIELPEIDQIKSLSHIISKVQ